LSRQDLALLSLVKGLPRTFPASVLVTIHLPSHARSAFAELLTRAGSRRAQFAGDGDRRRTLFDTRSKSPKTGAAI
jgi:two-component system chemotaxis response regulator CheB